MAMAPSPNSIGEKSPNQPPLVDSTHLPQIFIAPRVFSKQGHVDGFNHKPRNIRDRNGYFCGGGVVRWGGRGLVD